MRVNFERFVVIWMGLFAFVFGILPLSVLKKWSSICSVIVNIQGKSECVLIDGCALEEASIWLLIFLPF